MILYSNKFFEIVSFIWNISAQKRVLQIYRFLLKTIKIVDLDGRFYYCITNPPPLDEMPEDKKKLRCIVKEQRSLLFVGLARTAAEL